VVNNLAFNEYVSVKERSAAGMQVKYKKDTSWRKY
jgi:hypothetical protein